MLKTKTSSTRLRCTTRRHDFTSLGERKKVETSIKANFMPCHRHTPTHNNTKHNTHNTHAHHTQSTQKTYRKHTRHTTQTEHTRTRARTHARTTNQPINQGSANGSLRSGQPRRLPTSCHSAKRAVVFLCGQTSLTCQSRAQRVHGSPRAFPVAIHSSPLCSSVREKGGA